LNVKMLIQKGGTGLKEDRGKVIQVGWIERDDILRIKAAEMPGKSKRL